MSTFLDSFEWDDLTPVLPATESSRIDGRTNGIAVDQAGRIVVFRQATPAVVILRPDHQFECAWGANWPGAHGLTLSGSGSDEQLWLTDCTTGRVGRYKLDGTLEMEIPPPPEERRVDGKYNPTWVAVDHDRGTIWIADGYGSNLVHCHGPEGNYRFTITGEEGPGRFQRPHGIAFSPKNELWITDRRRMRIAIYDVQGRFVRHADHVAHSPCMFAFHHDIVFVPELYGAVKVLDHELRLLHEIGANDRVRPKGGWPEQEGWGAPTLPGWPNLNGTAEVSHGRFVAPHCAAVNKQGNLYVAEWMVGGRISCLS